MRRTNLLRGTWVLAALVSLAPSGAAQAQSSAAVARPQTPAPSFPYRAEEVAFDNAAGGSHLAGTLTLPAAGGPFAAVVLITGSGLQDRDETILGHKPFLLWADTLTRRGVAVLRVDDRTMGGSTGEVKTATTADFAGDVQAAVAYLRTRRDIDPRRIGLMGHSEGAVIAAIVAARDPKTAFIVMLAGSGEDGETLMLHQKRAIETAMGLPPAVVDKSNANMRALEDAVKGAPDQATADARLQAAWSGVMIAQGQPAETPVQPGVRAVASPWMRWFLAYDPRPTLARVICPVMAVDGSKDLQVLPKENLAGIKAGLAHDRDVTVAELPGLNHLLQTAGTGAPSEYATITETLSPLALKTVGDWIVAHTR